ncbi:hypothetical protein LOTGIDRAFT_152717 [Lottia gigantea]|uniref:Chitin-binding type-2 domain-containing protein n=1 Tax=Lottia gigantea TaxID=225164 RepID=V4AUX9_LOTGI|nr:hypothetical protein LOTGIDRAFT_152717 [Lottia gigantea]ESO97626.1 hypothetical protein LOTGIDRAFT_152717 [Lottia gigantea]
MCIGCNIFQGIGYTSFKGDCTKYVQCESIGEKVVGQVMSCAPGMFWNPMVPGCSPAQSTSCKYDKCRASPEGSKNEIVGSCRSYYECVGKKSKIGCCKIDEIFVKDTCVLDTTASCSDGCLLDLRLKAGVCSTRRAVTGDDTVYEALNARNQWTQLSCTAGNKYDAVSCYCIAQDTVSVVSSNPTDLVHHLTHLHNGQAITSSSYALTAIAKYLVSHWCTGVVSQAFRPNPYDCSMYVHCALIFDTVQKFNKTCRGNLFWSNTACAFAKDVDCEIIQCETAANGATYPIGNNCKNYYECSDGKTEVKCCETGQYYDGSNCVPDTASSCSDDCIIESTDTSRIRCELMAHFEFDWDYVDSSTNRIIPATTNTELSGTSTDQYITFNSTSNMILWYFANMEFGKILDIRLRFRLPLEADTGARYTILANCFGLDDMGPSIYIGVQSGVNKKIVAFLDTTDDVNMKEISVPYFGGWTDIRLTYDGMKLQLQSGIVMTEDIRSGAITRRQPPLVFGVSAMPDDVDLIGLIDEFQISKCIPPITNPPVLTIPSLPGLAPIRAAPLLLTPPTVNLDTSITTRPMTSPVTSRTSMVPILSVRTQTQNVLAQTLCSTAPTIPVILPVSGDCASYIECSTINGVLNYQTLECSPGYFFDASSQSCKWAGDVTCMSDVCRVSPAGTNVALGTSCKNYYKCEFGKSVVSCCGPGEMFDGKQCQVDSSNTCTENCLITSSPVLLSSLKISDNTLCEGCVISDNFGYNHHPEDCSLYVQCEPIATGFKATIRKCAVGFFWSKTSDTCVPSNQVQCKNDKCLSLADKSTHPMRDNCRSYYECKNSKSYTACCALGYEYLSGDCVIDTDGSCTDRCVTDPVKTKSTWKDPCTYQRAVLGDELAFERFSNDANTWIRMSCNTNSKFDSTTCLCMASVPSIKTSATATGCFPDADYPFNTDRLDKSTPPITASITAPLVNPGDKGFIRFQSSHRMVFWKYSAFEFGESVEVRLKFRLPSSANNGERYTIIANCLSLCEDGLGPGIYLGIQTGTPSYIIGMVDTTDNNDLKELKIPYTDGWVDIKLRYDGKKVLMQVDGTTAEDERTGPITRRQTALMLGRFAIPGDSNLIGDVDSLQIYTCLP